MRRNSAFYPDDICRQSPAWTLDAGQKYAIQIAIPLDPVVGDRRKTDDQREERVPQPGHRGEREEEGRWLEGR